MAWRAPGQAGRAGGFSRLLSTVLVGGGSPCTAVQERHFYGQAGRQRAWGTRQGFGRGEGGVSPFFF